MLPFVLLGLLTLQTDLRRTQSIKKKIKMRMIHARIQYNDFGIKLTN